MRCSLLFLILPIFSVVPMSQALEKDSNKVNHLASTRIIDNFQQQSVDSQGVNIRYLEAGEGEVMIFLHGYPFYGLSWDKVLQAFSDSYHVVAPDNRGFNLSEKPSNVEDYKLSKLIGDVTALADKVSPNHKIILVGHDWGGALAWAFTQVYPDRVSKIVVINAPPFNVLLDSLKNDPEQQKASVYMDILKSGKVELMFAQTGPEMLWNYGFNKLYSAGMLDEEFKQEFFAAWQQPRALKSALNWYRANIPPFDKIGEGDYFPAKGTRIKVPSLLIWTENERTFSRGNIDKTAELADDIVVEWILDSGHSPFLDKPEQVVEKIMTFLQAEKISSK